MGHTIDWKPEDPCPNCGGPVQKINPPPQWRIDAAKDLANGTPVPQTFDTAPADVIAEKGELYRCVPCWSQMRVKPAAPAAA